MSSYRVVIEGTTLPGFVTDDVRPRLAALVNRSEEVAAKLLTGQPSTVKSGVDQATGTRYVNALTSIGVACRVERETLDIDLGQPEATGASAAPAQKEVAADKATARVPPFLHSAKGPDDKFCTECGAVIKVKAEICPNCGVRQIAAAKWEIQGTPAVTASPTSAQRKWSPGVAALLSLVIPGAGQMHKGNVGRRLVWLICVAIGYAAMVVPGLILHLICIFNAASGDPTK